MPRTTQKPIKSDIPRPYEALGQRIKDARTKAGLNQSDIVSAGVASAATIMRVETGQREPSVQLLEYLRRELGVDLNAIITGE